MAKTGSYRWEGKEKIRKDRETMDRREVDEVDDLRFVIDELRWSFDHITVEHNGTPEFDEDPYFDLHTNEGPY